MPQQYARGAPCDRSSEAGLRRLASRIISRALKACSCLIVQLGRSEDQWMKNAVESKRILLVEDDPNIALMIQEVLIDEGAAGVRLAASVSAALVALQEAYFDAAILDLRLGNEMSWPVAAELSRRGIPYLTVSGYGDTGDERLLGARLLAKPYSIDALLQAIDAILKPSAGYA